MSAATTRAGASAATGWPVRRLHEHELDPAAALWNASLGDWHPLARAGIERWWRSRDTDPELVLAVEEHGALVGVALARAPERPWSPPEVGHLSLIAVAPEVQGRGVGRALWSAVADRLRARGRSELRLGGDPDHLLPGVPVVVPEGSWRFLARRGVRFGALEADLLLDLRAGAPECGTDARVRVEHAPDEVVARVRAWFPGRWADEVERAAERRVRLLAAREHGRTVGFAVASLPDDAVLGPGLVWSGALPGRPGGLGPLGVDPELRGRGLGIAMVAAAARWHAERGTQDLVFDWTSLGSFYGRLGARAWRVYQRGTGPVAPA